MKTYKCIYINRDVETELNEYAKKGWKLICPSCKKWWFILEKEENNIKGFIKLLERKGKVLKNGAFIINYKELLKLIEGNLVKGDDKE